MDNESPINQDDSSSEKNDERKKYSSSSSRSSRNSEKVKKSNKRKSSPSSSQSEVPLPNIPGGGVQREQGSPERDGKRSKKIFDYDIFLDSQQIETFYAQTKEGFQPIYDRSGVRKIVYDNQIIPDMTGKIVKIMDDNKEHKQLACQQIFRLIIDGLNQKSNTISIIILIPEGMVSLLIGKQGRQINKIMEDSNTKVVANQPINGMNQRTIGITGHFQDVCNCIQIIYDIMQERSAIVYDIEKLPTQVSVDKLVVKARFIFSYNLRSYLMQLRSKSGRSLLGHIDQKMTTVTQFFQERNSYVQRDEYICQIKGKLEPVQQTLCALFRKINEYYVQERSKPDYKIKLLIPYSYVTKLIGKEGCMIRDLAAKSGGAQIKIMSHKGDERHCYECPIEVAGTLPNKQDACCLVIEKIEQFKNGGPILKTGNALNENLVEQYKNSVQDSCVQHDQRFQQQLRELDEEFDRSGSGSPGRRRHDYHNGGGRRKTSGGHYQGAPDYQQRKSRTRSRSREMKKEKYGYDQRDMRGGMNRRMEEDGGRGGRYQQNGMDSYNNNSHYADRQQSSRGGGGDYQQDRHGRVPIDDRRQQHSRQSYSPKRRQRDNSREQKKGWEEQTSSQKLKIPIIVTSKLVQEFQNNNYKIIKQIQDFTSCKISIEKEKRLILNGTVENNTQAFKKIQQEFLKLGNE